MDRQTTKQKMQQARDLIKEKRYSEARDILETVEHPVAQQWLDRLDEIVINEFDATEAKTTRKRSGNDLGLVVVAGVGVAALLVGIIIGAIAFPRSEATPLQETAVDPPTAVPEIAAQPVATTGPECWQDDWWAEVDPMIVNFFDVAETATQTSRMSLSGIILDMQQIYRSFQRVDYPACVRSVRSNIDTGMEYAIQGFNDFLGQEDVLSGVYFDLATEEFASAYEKLLKLGLFSSANDVRMADTAVMIWGGTSPEDMRATFTALPPSEEE